MRLQRLWMLSRGASRRPRRRSRRLGGEQLEVRNLLAGTTPVEDLWIEQPTPAVLSSPQAFLIDAIDVNEHPPVFTSDPTASVQEDFTGGTFAGSLVHTPSMGSLWGSKTIYTASTTDGDSTPWPPSSAQNAFVSYSIKPGVGDADLVDITDVRETPLGGLPQETRPVGVVTLKASTDFETRSSYSFTIVATNEGVGATLVAEQDVSLAVIDVNDHAPVFTSGSSGSVAESAPVTEPIYVAVTTDADGTAANRIATYAIKPGVGDADLVAIDPATGVVRLKASADFETKNSYTFTVVATNVGTKGTRSEFNGPGLDFYEIGTLVTEQAVTVTVADINEALRTEFVQMPEGRAYRAGEVVRFKLGLSQPVTVVGKPAIALVAGTGAKSAVYVAGSGTNSLTFQYVVGRNDNAATIVLGSKIVLPTKNTTIRDLSSKNLPLGIPGGLVPNASFDTITPTIRSVTAPANGVYRPGDVLRLTVVFSENVRVTGSATIALTLDRRVVRQAQYVSGSGTRMLRFQYVVQPGDSAAKGLSAASVIKSFGGVITDAANNVSRLTFTAPSLSRVVISSLNTRQAAFASLAGV